jgi:mono/diheme cytochrome c family protein
MALLVLLTTGHVFAQSYREMVEADWLRQAEWAQSDPSAGEGGKRAKQAQPAPAMPAPTKFPTAAFLARARLLAADLKTAGVNTQPCEQALATIEAELKTLPADAAPQRQRELYLKTRWVMRRLAFSNPLLGFRELVFCKRFTQETYPDVCLNHMPWVSRPGGDLCVVTLAGPEGEPRVRALLSGALGPGHVHGMDLWWDATRVVFGYAKSKSNEPVKDFPGRLGHQHRLDNEPTHLFEIGIDGKNLRQLTDHRLWSDLDPTYLPNGAIGLVSERCGASLQCNEMDKDETSCNLYAMQSDGSCIRRLSVSKDGDYLPHCLDDGTIGYTRWEYEQRGWANIQSLWTVRPDGTGADAWFKQHLNNPWALEDFRSIPGTNNNKLVAIAAGHHTLAAGPVVIITPSDGMNDPRAIRIVTPGVHPPEGGMSGSPVDEGGVTDRGGFYMTPWPLSQKYFLASYSYSPAQTERAGYGLYLIDVFGAKELLYRDPGISCFVPIPLRPRPRPPLLADTTDPSKNFAVCSLTAAAFGMPGVEPRRARYLRILQGVQWPYDRKYGGQRYEPDAKGAENWNPTRVIGTVPLAADGSAHFKVPVDQAVYFQLLDENQMELRRMRSFISFQPGERRACVGCHETKAMAPPDSPFPTAMLRDPVDPLPPPWGASAMSFLRDVQPIFDRHCTGCHNGMKPAGGLDFSGGLTSTPGGRTRNLAYDTIFSRNLVARSNVNDDARITMPLAFGSHRSKLVEVLQSGVCSKRVKLSREEWLRLVTWIDLNGPYHDRFINKRQPRPAYDLPADRQLESAIAAVHATRCQACHKPADVTRLSWIDLRQPDHSLFLIAPLAKPSGGAQKCSQAVYKDSSDADYQAVRTLVRKAVEKAWQLPRRDLESLARLGGTP